MTERYFTVGRRETLFLSRGGGRTPPCESLLPVMDQLPVTGDNKDSYSGVRTRVPSSCCLDSLQDVSLLQIVFASVF